MAANANRNTINLIGSSRNQVHFSGNRFLQTRNGNTSRRIKIAPVRKFKKLIALNPVVNRSRPLISRQPTMTELTGWSQRNDDRRLEVKTAITCCVFVKEIMKDTEDITTLDLYGDLKTIEDWTRKGLDGLFQAKKDKVLLTVGWVLRFRNCVAHKWLRRIVKYRHEQLSAIYHLCGDSMINEPGTRKAALDRLNQLGLTPLPVLPPL